MGASESVWAVYRLEQFRNDGPRSETEEGGKLRHGSACRACGDGSGKNRHTLCQQTSRTSGCSERSIIQLYVAVDEVFRNIVRYTYSPGTGFVTVRVEEEEDPRRVQITFVDRGVPYNPVAEERPDVSRLPKAERPLGGLGLFMVKKTMDEISYSYQDGQNVLSIRKRV